MLKAVRSLYRRITEYLNTDFDSAMFFLYMIFYVVCYTIATIIYTGFGLYNLALLPFAGVVISIFSTVIHRKGYRKPAALLRTLSTAVIIFVTAYHSGGIEAFPIIFLSGAALGAYLVIGKTAGKLVASVSILLMCVLYVLDCPPSALNPEQMRLAAIVVQCINIPFVVLVGAIYGARADVFRTRSEREKQKAIESRQKTAAVMDAVRGAIFSFNGDFVVTEKNNITGELFGENFSFHDVLAMIEVDRPAELKEALGSIMGESVMNFEVNEHCLSTTARIRGRRYLLTWKPLIDANEFVRELVVAFIDNEEELKAKERAQQADIISSYMGILADLEQEKSLSIIDNISSAIAKARKQIPEGEKQAAFRELHTIKGVTRALKFDHLAARIHETESALGYPDEALRLLDGVEREFDKIKSAAKKLKFDGNYIKIEKSLVDKALQENTEREVFLGLKYKTLNTIFESFLLTLPDEAHKRKKPTPRLIANTHKIYLVEQAVTCINNALSHIISNALDHGIEMPEERSRKGKPAQGNITIRASVSDRLVIRVSDDGGGLAIGRIMEKAASKGLIEPGRLYTPNEKAAFIFESEFSTRDQVSETAGRGVGMDAVRANIGQIGGKVWAEVYSDEEQAPWELVIELPLNCIVKT